MYYQTGTNSLGINNDSIVALNTVISPGYWTASNVFAQRHSRQLDSHLAELQSRSRADLPTGNQTLLSPGVGGNSGLGLLDAEAGRPARQKSTGPSGFSRNSRATSRSKPLTSLIEAFGGMRPRSSILTRHAGSPCSLRSESESGGPHVALFYGRLRDGNRSRLQSHSLHRLRDHQYQVAPSISAIREHTCVRRSSREDLV